MTPFLHHVAADLLRRFGTDLRHLTLVCPGKRPALFIDQHLRALCPGVRLPRHRSIDRLFRSLSGLTMAEPIETVCRIYHIARRLDIPDLQHYTLDEFFGWGEQLLQDFDEIDKYMVNADMLLSNLADLKALEQRGTLNEEQVEVLRKFFQGIDFEGGKVQSEMQRRYFALWRNMLPIYKTLREELQASGKAYEGMLERIVAESDICSPEQSTFVAVGFNRLLPTEERLMRQLDVQTWYWDYDATYLDTPAGAAIRRGIALHGSALPPECFANVSKEKSVEYVATTTDSSIAQSVTPWLRAHRTTPEERTAIVLCDESLLQNVIEAIPEEVERVNITKGFPLSSTLAATYIDRYLQGAEAQGLTAPRETLTALSDALVAERRRWTDEEHYDATDFDDVLQSEALTQAAELIESLTRLTDLRTVEGHPLLAVQPETLRALIGRVVRSTTIPFEGEPITGIQIMGMLETRSLDFDQVLILSASDDRLPAPQRKGSFIPMLLREAYGLPTAHTHAETFAYYFHRLLSRATHCRMVFNASTSGMRHGEMSRYLRQLLVTAPYPVRHIALTTASYYADGQASAIDKPADIAERIKRISPSDLNTYLRCPLAFYYNKVCGLRLPDEEKETMQPNTLGTIFHAMAEQFYKTLSGEAGFPTRVERADLLAFTEGDEQRREARYQQLLEAAVAEELAARQNTLRRQMQRRATPPTAAEIDTAVAALRPNRPDAITRSLLFTFLTTLLRYDATLCPFTYKAAEENYAMDFDISAADGTTHRITLSGIVDRLDIVHDAGGDLLRIVDYKTGGKVEQFNGDLTSLFTPSDKRPHYILQTFLYALMLLRRGCQGAAAARIAPALFFVHHAKAPDFSPYIICHPSRQQGTPITDFAPYADEMEEKTRALLAEIIDTTQPFKPTTLTSACAKCEFHALCKGRER